MTVTNEWSKLKRVIVGIADNAKMPKVDISVRTVNHADIKDSEHIPVGVYPQQVIDEANEDLNVFCDFLQQEGVDVLRPDNNNPEYYNYCPRDSVFVYGNKAYATPMPIKCRQQEYTAFSKHLQHLEVIDRYKKDDLYNLNCIGDSNTLALTEVAPSFDAANIIRANEDILYLVSNSGNLKGANLLQEILGSQTKIHTLKNVYSYMHIDSTVAFLRDGLLLANPERIKNKYVLPKPFCDWDVIWAPEPVDIGYHSGICNASKWINMNLFSVSPELVVLEKHQNTLRKQLEQRGIDCAMLPISHQRTLGGGFHCVTLDIERD